MPKDDRWQTSLTSIAPDRILVRGYALDEMMGRLTFAEAVYLLLMGELPTPAIGRMFDAILVSSIDHGVTPPSTLAARNVATSGAPLKDSVGAGVLAFGPRHGGDIESCMRFLDRGVALARTGKNPFQLDSRAPAIPLEKYIYNETRYSMLVHSDPKTAARMLAEAQQDVNDRWGMYEYMAAMPTSPVEAMAAARATAHEVSK